ncbi:hypothetical protein [Streptomyces goshikiensis]|uniref:hypothetical protein n=1 Tax=Streptomyces goshikiensis TaxID=1942 RepID=UPI003680FD4F
MTLTSTFPATTIEQIGKITKQDELWEIHSQARHRLVQCLLIDLEKLLRPSIKAARDAGISAEHLVVRAGTYEVTRQRPWPVRFDADAVYTSWETNRPLAVPDDAREEVESIIFQLTKLHGALISGHTEVLGLPKHLY